MAVMRADIPRPLLLDAIRAGKVISYDGMAPLTEEDVTEAAEHRRPDGTGPFRNALKSDVDVIVAGRACDTAIFASLPALLGFPVRTGDAHGEDHRVRIALLCAGGRDFILAQLDQDCFILESMNRIAERRRPRWAAHSL